MDSLDHLLHGLPTCRLQWSHAAPRQKPHACVLVTAIDNIDAVTRNRVMECGARVIGNESEESLPPRVIGVTEQLVSERLKFFNADRANGFGNGFAALLVEAPKVEFFEWHRISLPQSNMPRQAMKEM
jgi:hypothetical protein